MVRSISGSLDDEETGTTAKFDLRSLHGFVGGDLSRVPYLSPFGALLRLARLNQFTRTDFYAAFDIRLVSSEDLAKVLAFSERRLDSFSVAIGVDAGQREGWKFNEWLPFHGDVPDSRSRWEVRACIPCLREGFHTWLFQMPWTTRCPWHGTPLNRACPNCGRSFALSFKQGAQLLRCECGIDFFDRRVALRADASHNNARDSALAAYLAWAKDSRTKRRLICPLIGSESGNVLIGLANAPSGIAAAERPPSQRFRSEGRRALSVDARHELMLLSSQVEAETGTVLEVPLEWVPPLRAIATGIARHVPPGTLFPVEAEQSIAEGAISAGSNSEHVDMPYLPVQTTGEKAYVYGNCIPRPSLVALNHLLLATEFSWHDEISASHVFRAAQALVLRAYADGLRILLDRYIAALHSHPRLQPWEHVPWIVVTAEADRVSAIHIEWTRERADHLHPSPSRPSQ